MARAGGSPSVGFDLDVDGRRVRVRFVPSSRMQRDSKGHAMGGDYGDNLIKVSTAQTRRGVRAAVLHEIGHHVLDRAEVKVPTAVEEDVADAFCWLLPVLRDNPKFTRWLMEEV